MATLNTLRTKGGWIVSIVIGLALLAFLIGDLAGGNSVFGVKEKVGKIDGSSISYMEYEQKVQYLTEITKITSGTESLSTEQSDMIRNYAWESLISETAILPGFEAMGLQVTDDEMFDRIYGNNISPVLLNSGIFNNQQTGMYDKALVQNFVSNYQSDPSGRMGMLWQYLQEQVRQDALLSKYMALVGGMAYVTGAEADQSAARMSASYNSRYVQQAYTSVPDSLFHVGAAEVKKYYDERKELYKQAASRNVEYVVFEVMPSAADYREARNTVDQLAAEFAETDNMQQFVSLNSHDSFDAAYYTKGQLPADVAEYAFNPDRTNVYGPMQEGQTFQVIRVSDMQNFPDTIAFRQMGFAPGTEMLSDSVYNELLKGADFLLMADQYSMLSPEMTEAGRVSTQFIPMEIGEQLYASRQKYTKITNPNGTFIFEVYYRGASSPKVQLATLAYHVEPSTATQQAAYAKASGFYTATAGIADKFNKIAADSLYSKRTAQILSGQTQVSGLDNAREMIRWAFNSKPGSISPIMEINNNYVVSVLTEARENGYVAVEDVQSQIVTELLRQKKGDMIAEKMKGAASLDALAGSLSTTVGEISDVNYGLFYLPEIGVEPAVIGAIAGGVPEGQISKPIKGYTGVYVVEITSKTATGDVSAELERVRLEAQNETNLQQRAYGAMIGKSNVVDGRSKYF